MTPSACGPVSHLPEVLFSFLYVQKREEHVDLIDHDSWCSRSDWKWLGSWTGLVNEIFQTLQVVVAPSLIQATSWLVTLAQKLPSWLSFTSSAWLDHFKLTDKKFCYYLASLFICRCWHREKENVRKRESKRILSNISECLDVDFAGHEAGCFWVIYEYNPEIITQKD